MPVALVSAAALASPSLEENVNDGHRGLALGDEAEKEEPTRPRPPRTRTFGLECVGALDARFQSGHGRDRCIQLGTVPFFAKGRPKQCCDADVHVSLCVYYSRTVRTEKGHLPAGSGYFCHIYG